MRRNKGINKASDEDDWLRNAKKTRSMSVDNTNSFNIIPINVKAKKIYTGTNGANKQLSANMERRDTLFMFT